MLPFALSLVLSAPASAQSINYTAVSDVFMSWIDDEINCPDGDTVEVSHSAGSSEGSYTLCRAFDDVSAENGTCNYGLTIDKACTVSDATWTSTGRGASLLAQGTTYSTASIHGVCPEVVLNLDVECESAFSLGELTEICVGAGVCYSIVLPTTDQTCLPMPQYIDLDGDGFGAGPVQSVGCSIRYVHQGGDPDDTDADVYPDG